MKNQLNVILKTGLIATSAMTAVMFMAPLMGLPKMPIGNMLAGFMHVPVVAGWIAHFMIGILLAGGYVIVLKAKLPGSAVVKGLIYSFIPFLIAQLMVMPMMGAGIFSSATVAPTMMVMGSLIGHLVYGAALGVAT